MRVAIVSQEDTVREVLKYYFQKNKLTVETFENGMDALERIKISPFGIILTDLVLPDITGVDLYDRVRKCDGDEKTPVFFISARNISSELSRRMKSDSSVMYFQKPFDPVEILMQAGRVIRK